MPTSKRINSLADARVSGVGCAVFSPVPTGAEEWMDKNMIIRNNKLQTIYRNCFILTIASAIVPAWAQPPGGERTAAALMSIEQQWLAAINQHDVATLARILGREFIDSDFQGDAITRAQYLAYFARPVAHPAQSVPMQQRFAATQVRFVAGGEVAIVTGVVVTRAAAAKTAVSTGPDAVRHSRFTDVFVWRDARWQAVTGQETHFTRDQKIQ
jgi:hypothetical protein